MIGERGDFDGQVRKSEGCDNRYTISDYTRARRLEAVHRELTDPLSANRDPGRPPGFTDQAHFARTFPTR